MRLNCKNMDTDKIDNAVLGLLYLSHWLEGPHDIPRSWKSFDWDTLARLHEKGLISDPVRKTKSVVLSEDGIEQAKDAFQKLFSSAAQDHD